MYIPGHYAFILFAILLAQSSVLFVYTVIGLLKSSPIPLFGPPFPPPPELYHDSYLGPLHRGLPVRHGDVLGLEDQLVITTTETKTVTVTSTALIQDPTGLGVLLHDGFGNEPPRETTTTVTSVVTSVEQVSSPASQPSTQINFITPPAATVTVTASASLTMDSVKQGNASTSATTASAQVLSSSSASTITSAATAPASTCVRLVYEVEALPSGYLTHTQALSAQPCIPTPTR